MKLKKLLRGVEVRSMAADEEMEIGGVCYDSRAAKPGDLFVAMTGYETDGHRFIPMAAERGAACVLCERPPEGTEIPSVLVPSSREALADVSANYFGHPAEEGRRPDRYDPALIHYNRW